MRCEDCKYYRDLYGGICFGQKNAPRVDGNSICDDFLSKDAEVDVQLLESTGNVVSDTETRLVTCEECVYQSKVFCSDARYIEGGYYIYRCLLNDNPFERHAVDGYSDEYCSSAVKRGDDGK